MKFYDLLSVRATSLLQNRLRSGLSILGILIGIASVFCMMALSEGAKKLIADDIDKLGGANQFKLTTRALIIKHGRFVRWTRERFTLEDALAIEAACPNVINVLPKNRSGFVTFKTRQGQGTQTILEGVMANYAY